MKQFTTLLLAPALASVLGATVARSAILIEDINATVASGAPWEASFPNEYDPFHPMQLRFEGVATVGGNPTTPVVHFYVSFNWVDPMDPMLEGGSGSWLFYVPEALGPTPIDMPFTIAICPPQVSLRFDAVSFGGVVNVAGKFTRECIPEPGASVVVASLGLLGFAGWRWRTGLGRPRGGD